MTVDEVMNMSIDDWNRASDKELRAASHVLFSAANKRLKSIEGEQTPAYRSVMESGGKFSTKVGDRNKVMKEFARARRFMQMKTSTLKGAKQVEKEFQKRVGGDTQEMTAKQRGNMWKAFHEVKESDPTLSMDRARYNACLTEAYRLSKLSMSTDDMLRELKTYNDNLYMNNQDTEGFYPYEDGEGVEDVPF